MEEKEEEEEEEQEMEEEGPKGRSKMSEENDSSMADNLNQLGKASLLSPYTILTSGLRSSNDFYNPVNYVEGINPRSLYVKL